MTTELKPCPLCGCEMKAVARPDMIVAMHSAGDDCLLKALEDSQSGLFSAHYEPEFEELAELWNTRASPLKTEAEVFSNDDGDTWQECPDDMKFVSGLNVGDEYSLLASTRPTVMRFRVVKAPDDVNDDYEVEAIPLPPAPASEGS
jgi:hypothetical protein